MSENIKDLFVEIQNYRVVCISYPQFKSEADDIYEKTNDLKAVNDFCEKVINRKNAEKLKVEANLNKRFATRTFDNFKINTQVQKAAFNEAKNYADNINKMMQDGKGIVFAGGGCVGTGKTHLAYAIANQVLNSGVPVKVINVTDLANDLKKNFDTRKYIDVEILLIDDLGKEQGTAWICEALYNIFNSRYENMKPTIITTENGLADISINYITKIDGKEIDRGKSIVSRLTESFIYVQLTGEDYRQKRDKN